MHMHHSKLKFFSNVYFPSDIDNFELVCLFVKNYKVFAEGQLINFNAKYAVSYEKGVLTIDDEEGDASLFPDWLNLKIICGENGSGKTTILDILDYDLYSAKESFVVLKTPDGFLCNKRNIKIQYKKQPSVILDKGVDHFQPDFLRGRIEEESEHCFPYFLVQSYAKNKNIYDAALETENLFTDFYIFLSRIDYRIRLFISRFNYHLKMLDSDFDIVAFRQYYEKNPAFFIAAYFINDTLYDKVLYLVLNRHTEYVDKTTNININKLLDITVEEMVGKESFSKLKKLSEKLNCLLYAEIQDGKVKKFTPASYSLTTKSVSSMQKQFDAILQKIISLIDLQNPVGNLEYLKKTFHWTDFFRFVPFRKAEDNNVGLSMMSSGEQQLIKCIYNLVGRIRYRCIYDDEIDAHLHPEWSRRLIFNYEKIFKILKKQSGSPKTYNVILVTHSPFVLSDMAQNQVEYFQKENGKTNVLSGKQKNFAGNIGQLFSNSFFMKSTIGAFSEDVLKKQIRNLEQNPTEDNVEQAKKIFSMVSDPLLKALLFEKICICKECCHEKN